MAWPIFAFSQADSCTFSFDGKVVDIETKEPIPFVTIKLNGTDKFTHTNFEGDFHFDSLCTQNNTFSISCYGYCTSVCNQEHHDQLHPIFLNQQVTQLETVLLHVPKNEKTGTKTIAQVRIEKSEFNNNPAQSLASMMAEQEGVTFASTGSNVQLPVIHGLYGNRILILNNGLKHGFQNWGTDHAPEIDVSSANAITLIKGAAGVRYGPEALGGAIIIEPNPLHLNEPFYAKIGLGAETNGRGLSSKLAGGQGFKKWSYFINGNLTKIGDRHTSDYQLSNSGKEETSFGFGTRYHHKNWDIKIHYSNLNQKLALLRSAIAESGNAFVKAINSNEPTFITPFSYDINAPYQLTGHQLLKSEINWWYSDDAKLTFQVGKQVNNRKEYDVRRNIDKPIIDLDLLTSDYQLEWKHPSWFKLNGVLGLQAFVQDNDNNPGTGTSPFVPNYNTQRYSAYLIESRKFGKNTFEAGLRLDNENNNVRGRESNQSIFRDKYSFTNLSSSIGYVREISKNSSFRTNIGTAWRPPNMAELYSFGQHGFQSSFGLLRHTSNSENVLSTDRVIAMSESATQAEQGYKFINEFHTHKNKSTHTLSVYSHYIKNYIYDRPYAVIGTVRGPMPVFIYEQADAFFIGTDYSWKIDWTKQLSGNLGFSYLYSQNTSKNEALIKQAPVALHYQLIWKQAKFWFFESSKVSAKPSYTFQQYHAPQTISPEKLIDGSVLITPETEIFDFKDAPEGYFLIDLAWHFTWKNIEGSIAVNNVLNTSYRSYLNEMRYFVDEPGRNLLFSFNYLFKHTKDE